MAELAASQDIRGGYAGCVLTLLRPLKTQLELVSGFDVKSSWNEARIRGPAAQTPPIPRIRNTKTIRRMLLLTFPDAWKLRDLLMLLLTFPDALRLRDLLLFVWLIGTPLSVAGPVSGGTWG
jgi:hypothetical protein